MSKKRVSILGGGWLGAPLATYLEEKGYRTQVSTASEERYAALQASHDLVAQIKVLPNKVTGDWENFSQAEILVINIPPTRSSDQEQFAALLPLIVGSPIEKVLFVSSTSVYRDVNREVTEDEGIEDKDNLLYKSEQAFRETETFETTVVRLAGLVGGARHPGRFFRHSGVVRQGDAPVNLVHRVDVLNCLHRIIEKEYWGKVVNVCADTHPLRLDYYPTAASAIGMPMPVVEQKGAPSYKIVANQKMKAELGVELQEPDLIDLLRHWH